MFISSVLLLAIYFNTSLCTRKKKSARSHYSAYFFPKPERENCMSETKPSQTKTKTITNFIQGDITVAFNKRSIAKLIT